MNIVCLGDSITEGREFAPSERWTARLQVSLDQWRPGRFRVYNRGVGGDTTAQGLDRFNADVVPALPAVVLVQFGLNDANIYDWADGPRVSLARFRENLRTLHARIHDGGGRCVYVVNHRLGPVGGLQGNGRSYLENVAPYDPAVREVARSLEAWSIDLSELMHARRIDAQGFVAADGLHLSARGNRLYAELVFAGLTPLLEAFEGES